MSSGNMVENILIEYKINASFSQFKKKLGEEGRLKEAIEMYARIKINCTL